MRLRQVGQAKRRIGVSVSPTKGMRMTIADLTEKLKNYRQDLVVYAQVCGDRDSITDDIEVVDGYHGQEAYIVLHT
jgi:hypothetical protein